ncbi:MAG: glycoside hydrolase [Phycisphaerae bacterium]|nr:glycoside hydrolase [Phycisphaerae bacterium]
MVRQLPDGAVEFHFLRPGAAQVSLAGDFNGWQPSFLMDKRADGWWHCRLKLAPGIYQFRYQADGQWYNDYAAFGLEHGPFGLNSVAKVDQTTAPETAAAGHA